jgi:hypothetical protein
MVRKRLAHPKLVEDCLNCLTLNFIQHLGIAS